MSTSPGIEWLSRAPRFPLGFLPTPLQPLDRLSEELGGPRIWLKRDDCTGLATGGNKTRKLEFLLGHALSEGRDTVITSGAVQSNHARQTAAACARAGLKCHLVLNRRVKSRHPRFEITGNIVLDRLFGAEIHLVGRNDAAAQVRDLASALEERGSSVYVIPAGGSSAVGALGYVQAAGELLQQCTEAGITPQRIYHASSSAGTQAGLRVGLGCLHSTSTPIGINVYHDNPDHLRAAVNRLTEQICSVFSVSAQPADLVVDHAYLAGDYGQTDKAGLDAIRLCAQLEGIAFDPVYSGKALHALIDHINLGVLDSERDVVLLHTGGTAVWSAYDHVLT